MMMMDFDLLLWGLHYLSQDVFMMIGAIELAEKLCVTLKSLTKKSLLKLGISVEFIVYV